MRIVLQSLLILTTAVALGCGDETVGLDDGGPDPTIDADPSMVPDADPGTIIDAGPNDCTPEGPECSDCEDNDGDGLIDGFDPHCTSWEDDDESSFATAIPGDNRDGTWQDCFFDGNSGAGDDGCNLHTCCLLDLMGGPCPPEYNPNQFDPNECTPTQECIDNCFPATPPGCDCFACCTICDPDGNCNTVMTNPAIAPECDIDVLDDPNLCPPCVQSDVCGVPCNPEECILCPGQSRDDLPPGCNGVECPNGLETCVVTADCPNPTAEFCSNGCCVGRVE